MSAVNRDDEPIQPSLRRLDGEQTSSVEHAVGELAHLTRRLRIFGLVALTITVVNIGTLFWVIFLTARSRYIYVEGGNSLVLTSIVFTVGTVVILSLFEALRKRGDVIFQELSDELQWHVGRRSGSEVPRERPLLDARVSLRAFSATSELPLIPGRFGGAIYAALNLSITLTSVLLIRT